MSEPIVYIGRSEVGEGKLDELKTEIRRLVDFVETHEERPMAYGIYLDESGRHMSVWQVHPDSASLEYHMEVAGPAFVPFIDLLRLQSIDVYGNPSAKLRIQLQRKAEMLGSGTVVVHDLAAGFTRFALNMGVRS